MAYKRGDIVQALFPYKDDPTKLKPRPVLIVSNGLLEDNLYAIIPFTSQPRTRSLIGVIEILEGSKGYHLMGLEKESYLQVYRITTIDKRFLRVKKGTFARRMAEMEKLLKQILGLY